jgi:hypothetical protein
MTEAGTWASDRLLPARCMGEENGQHALVDTIVSA